MSSTETTILRELLTADDGFVSGSFLAERLSVSRVSIWSHMEKLRAAGFDFEARPRLGYRLKKTPTSLSPLFLQALLPSKWEQVPVHFHESIDSTNSEAERLLAGNSPTPFAVIARAQTRGRGRLGRQWFSADSGNLYLSLVFQPRLPPRRMQTFTLWMGVTICDFLNQNQNIPVQVKWPNDLLLDHKKLGGMLTEARVDSDRIRDLVFGLGLNVNGQPGNLPPDLKDTATSIAAGTGHPIGLNRFTATLLTRILDGYQDFTQDTHQETFRRLWTQYDALLGHPVTTLQGGTPIAGTARGIDDEGYLLLEQPDHSFQRVSAGDVTLKKPGHA